MRGIFAILAGLGVGAGLMYLFDPQGGNRRRALIKDKAAKLNRQTREALEGTAKDLSNRARGMAHELKSSMSSESESTMSNTTTGWSDGPAV
jgi:gas vesicle protein